MPGRTIPTEAELKAYLEKRSNWGRWGDDDELGTVNLITPDKRLQAAGLIKSGRVVSLARQLRTDSSPSNPRPVSYGLRALYARPAGRPSTTSASTSTATRRRIWTRSATSGAPMGCTTAAIRRRS